MYCNLIRSHVGYNDTPLYALRNGEDNWSASYVCEGPIMLIAKEIIDKTMTEINSHRHVSVDLTYATWVVFLFKKNNIKITALNHITCDVTTYYVTNSLFRRLLTELLAGEWSQDSLEILRINR